MAGSLEKIIIVSRVGLAAEPIFVSQQDLNFMTRQPRQLCTPMAKLGGGRSPLSRNVFCSVHTVATASPRLGMEISALFVIVVLQIIHAPCITPDNARW